MPEILRPNEGEKPSLSERLNHLLETTISIEELSRLQEEQDEVTQLWHAGQITEEDYRQRVINFNQINKRCMLALDSLDELAGVMTLLGCEAEYIDWTLGHELSHFEEAMSQGLTPNYHVRVGLDEKEMIVIPGITASWENLDAELADLTERIKKVTSAPGELSVSDQRVLDIQNENQDP